MFGRKATLPIDIKMLIEVVNEAQCFNLNTSDIERITNQRLGIIQQSKINIEKAQVKQKQNYDMQTLKLIKYM